MKIEHYFLILLTVVIYSCSNENKKVYSVNNEIDNPMLFNLSQVYTPMENIVSFPNWFNDSIIITNGIKKITRKLYTNYNAADSNAFPEQQNDYYFNEKGGIVKMEVQQFYENNLIGAVTFLFYDVKDKNGFINVEISKKKHPNTEMIEDFSIYQNESETNQILSYSNGDNNLFFILEEKDWGIVSIGTNLRPEEADLIVLGSPKKQRKIFQLENMVNESNVSNFEYNANGLIDKLSFNNYPFYINRSFYYDSLGFCEGFVDSTFSSERYLTHQTTEINYLNETTLPSVVLQYNKANKPNGKYENIEYEFYEND